MMEKQKFPLPTLVDRAGGAGEHNDAETHGPRHEMHGNSELPRDVGKWSEAYNKAIKSVIGKHRSAFERCDCLEPQKVILSVKSILSVTEVNRQSSPGFITDILIYVIDKYFTVGDKIYGEFWDDLHESIQRAKGHVNGKVWIIGLLVIICKHLGFLELDATNENRPYAGGNSRRHSSCDIGDLVNFRHLRATPNFKTFLDLIFHEKNLHNELNLFGFTPENLEHSARLPWSEAWSGDKLFVLRRFDDRLPSEPAYAEAAETGLPSRGKSRGAGRAERREKKQRKTVRMPDAGAFRPAVEVPEPPMHGPALSPCLPEGEGRAAQKHGRWPTEYSGGGFAPMQRPWPGWQGRRCEPPAAGADGGAADSLGFDSGMVSPAGWAAGRGCVVFQGVAYVGTFQPAITGPAVVCNMPVAPTPSGDETPIHHDPELNRFSAGAWADDYQHLPPAHSLVGNEGGGAGGADGWATADHGSSATEEFGLDFLTDSVWVRDVQFSEGCGMAIAGAGGPGRPDEEWLEWFDDGEEFCGAGRPGDAGDEGAADSFALGPLGALEASFLADPTPFV